VAPNPILRGRTLILLIGTLLTGLGALTLYPQVLAWQSGAEYVSLGTWLTVPTNLGFWLGVVRVAIAALLLVALLRRLPRARHLAASYALLEALVAVAALVRSGNGPEPAPTVSLPVLPAVPVYIGIALVLLWAPSIAAYTGYVGMADGDRAPAA